MSFARISLFLLVLCGAALAGCSGSAVVTLARSGESTAFSTYTVDLTSLSLIKTDGSLKQVVSQSVRVDLADPAQVARLLAAPSMSAAEFAGGTVTLDYSNADVEVNVNGVPTAVTVVDPKGAALAAVTLPIQFASGGTLKIDQTHASQLALTIDLGSNAIDTTTSPIAVTARPAVLAVVDPDNSPIVTVAGTVSRVDTTGATIAFTLPSSDNLAAKTTDTTAFEINGATSFGSTGLASLSGLGTTSRAILFGQISAGVFTATRVLAGTSVAGNATSSTTDSLGATTPGVALASVSGTVIARTDATVTVRGARLDSGSGSEEFIAVDSTVLLADSTVVIAAENLDLTLTPASVSIGQRIVALGTSSTDAAGAVTLDASAGIVRLEDTIGYGTLNLSQSNGLDVNLLQLAGLPVGALNFSGAQFGSATTNTTHYILSTGTLDLTGLSQQALLQFSGITTAFTSAPPNFIALALVDSANVPANVLAHWTSGGGAKVLSTLSATQIVIDAANASLTSDHRLQVGPQILDLASSSASPPIVPDTSVSDTFGLQAADGTMTIYNNFATFTTALKAALGTASLVTFSAHGRYASGQFSASEILVQLQK